jgi:flagellar FliL protein
MKVIVIGILALAVLGGGGFGAYSYFMQQAQAATLAGEGGVDDAAKAAAAGEAEHKKVVANDPEHPLPVVELTPMIVPVIDREGISQTVSFIVSVQAVNELAADKVKYNEPRLKNAYLQEVYGILNRYAALKGGVLAVDTIKEHLNKASEKVLGENVVNDVVLEVVQQHPV